MLDMPQTVPARPCSFRQLLFLGLSHLHKTPAPPHPIHPVDNAMLVSPSPAMPAAPVRSQVGGATNTGGGEAHAARCRHRVCLLVHGIQPRPTHCHGGFGCWAGEGNGCCGRGCPSLDDTQGRGTVVQGLGRPPRVRVCVSILLLAGAKQEERDGSCSLPHPTLLPLHPPTHTTTTPVPPCCSTR